MNTLSTQNDLIWLGGFGVRTLVPGSATEGRASVLEHVLLPRAIGSPVHTHVHEDEFSTVLEGRLGVRIGDEEFQFGPGETVTKPRGIPHAFWNAGDEVCRFVEVISPAGFEDYFAAMAPAVAEQDFGAICSIASRFALDVRPETMPELIERHGLAQPM